MCWTYGNRRNQSGTMIRAAYSMLFVWSCRQRASVICPQDISHIADPIVIRHACRHQALIDVSSYPGDFEVPSF